MGVNYSSCQKEKQKMLILPVFCLLLMLRNICCADDQAIYSKIVRVGDHVTMTCSRKSAGRIFWMKVAFGNSPERLQETESLNSHIKVNQEVGTLVMKIIHAKKSDSAVYVCVRNHEGNITYLNVTYLTVEEQPVTRAPASDSVVPKPSVTLQCSVRRDFQNTSCPVDDSTYCFTAEPVQTHPSFSDAQVHENDQYQKKSEGFTEKKCLHSYLKSFSSSAVQMYSCGQAVSEETMMEDESKLKNKGVNPQIYKTVLNLLCGALVICLAIIAGLIYMINKLEKKANGTSNAVVGLQQHTPLRGNQETQQIDEDSSVYSAPASTNRKMSKKVRKSTSEEQETIYTEVNVLRL